MTVMSYIDPNKHAATSFKDSNMQNPQKQLDPNTL